MKRNRKDKDFVKKPYFKGGHKAMDAFLKKHKKYPQEALEKGIEGSVQIRYTISHEGKVIGTKVIAGIGYGCDAEAERIVRLLVFEVSKTHKLRVQFQKTIRVHFKLAQHRKQESHIIQYKLGSDKQEKGPEEEKSNKSYHYQIRW